MKGALSLLLLVAGCGASQQPTIAVRLGAVGELTLADCPTLPPSIPLHARVLFNATRFADGASNGDGSVPCDLKVELNAQSGAYAVSGACANIPAQTAPTVLTLQWYVSGPATQKFVLLAQATGSVKATGDKQTYLADFSGSAIKTKGTASDDSTERDRFNCDRTGASTCDSSVQDAVVTQDVDTCSNLEELCKDTLFDVSAGHGSDSCP